MRILHAIHDFLPRHAAGSEIYAYELCRALARRGHELHVLCAEYDPRRPHGSLDWRWFDDLPVTELINNWHFSSFEASYRSPAITAQLEHVLDAVAPDVLHIHNLLNLSFDLPAVAAVRGIPSAATLHEYVLLCPSGGQRVHLAEEHVCHDIDHERCARCFRQSHFYSQMAFSRLGGDGARMAFIGRVASALRRRFPAVVERLGRKATEHAPGIEITPDDIRGRFEAVNAVYSAVDLFVAPSPALGAEFRRFGLPEEKLRVSDYGFVPLRPHERPPAQERLRIGFVGTIAWHKGAHVLIEAVRRLPADRIEVLVFGGLDTFPDYAEGIRSSAADLPVRFLGGFDREEVAAVYAQMDILVIASLWPENSPLVIHEAFMAGVPVVGSRMGGTADLIEDGVNGLLYDAFSAEDLARALGRLLDEPLLLEKLSVSRTAVKTIDDDAAEWEATYREMLTARDHGDSGNG